MRSGTHPFSASFYSIKSHRYTWNDRVRRLDTRTLPNDYLAPGQHLQKLRSNSFYYYRIMNIIMFTCFELFPMLLVFSFLVFFIFSLVSYARQRASERLCVCETCECGCLMSRVCACKMWVMHANECLIHFFFFTTTLLFWIIVFLILLFYTFEQSPATVLLLLLWTIYLYIYIYAICPYSIFTFIERTNVMVNTSNVCMVQLHFGCFCATELILTTMPQVNVIPRPQ